jgi:hypothetical protein
MATEIHVINIRFYWDTLRLNKLIYGTMSPCRINRRDWYAFNQSYPAFIMRHADPQWRGRNGYGFVIPEYREYAFYWYLDNDFIAYKYLADHTYSGYYADWVERPSLLYPEEHLWITLRNNNGRWIEWESIPPYNLAKWYYTIPTEPVTKFSKKHPNNWDRPWFDGIANETTMNPLLVTQRTANHNYMVRPKEYRKFCMDKWSGYDWHWFTWNKDSETFNWRTQNLFDINWDCFDQTETAISLIKELLF